jgi:hypothetical protein
MSDLRFGSVLRRSMTVSPCEYMSCARAENEGQLFRDLTLMQLPEHTCSMFLLSKNTA